jgi:hypothetical protein
MGPTPSYWTPYPPDRYLDPRRPEWAKEVNQRWVRYFVCDVGAFAYVHALHAKRVVEVLGPLIVPPATRAQAHAS